jgi:hypothetical protein
MMDYVKNISFFLIIGLAVNLLVGWLKSDFLTSFLSANLITLLIALVAINTTTLSVVLTKVRELADKLGGNFDRTAKEMRISIIEQLVLIVAAILIQIVRASEILKIQFPAINFISDVALVAVLAYALYILYDTANSVFVILKFNEKDGPKDVTTSQEKSHDP